MLASPRTQAPDRVLVAAAADVGEVCAALECTVAGLSGAEAARRLARHGPNTVTVHRRTAAAGILLRAVANPLVGLLAILAGSSFAAGDLAAGGIMVVMLAIGVGLRFVQEHRAGRAAETLRRMIRIHASVLRDGDWHDVPLDGLVPGDVVHLAAGDMVPADVRLIACKDLFVAQGVLTGESFPVEKFAAPDDAPGRQPLERHSVCWLGTSVESGTGRALVVATGRDTLFAEISAALDPAEAPTAFDVGLSRFTWLMVGLVAALVPLVFLVNGFTKGDWAAAALFSLAVGVGLTPEMLPMIVAVCLARGALDMAGRRVVVKHLDSMQNLGAMDVLCTDKTGTLTLDRIVLERHCDVRLRADPEVLELAWLNSHFQTGLRNVMDRAILEHERFRGRTGPAGCTLVDEIPFDFTRRVMSVVVRMPDGRHRLICKGAPEAVYARCTAFEVDGVVHPLQGGVPEELQRECDALGTDGFRVLAVAWRDVEERPAYSREDERALVLRGYVAFFDPPKDSAQDALAALAGAGVAVKVLTGDNERVSGKICREVGLPVDAVLLGADVERMADAELAPALERATLLARLTPLQKARVVRLLRSRGHVVGYLGDGINDAPALRAADIGISVDSAADIALESADCVLLEKDLHVLAEGVRGGRRVFVNIIKYVRMGASSNFGNMLSVLLASVALPFVPMTPLQILANNLLYDCSQVAIPGDDVDPELIARPRPWDVRQISRFILLVGPCSSIFDCVTFAVMWLVFGADDPARAALFRTGWFVESLVTQTLVIHVIRTQRLPWLESRASRSLSAATLAVLVAGIWLAQSPLGATCGFVPLPAAYWPILIVTVAAYLAVTHAAMRLLVRHGWIA